MPILRKGSIGVLLLVLAAGLAIAWPGPVFVRSERVAPTIADAGSPISAHFCWSAPPSPEQEAVREAATYGSQEFQLAPRWSVTALSPAGLQQGDPTIVTWGLVDDGTSIESPVPLGGCAAPPPPQPSNLQQFLNGIYGSPAVWRPLIAQAFDQWESVTGLTFVEEPNDDGQPVANVCSINANSANLRPGTPGVRGDIRIGGRYLDGQSGTNLYALTYTPDHGDVVLDTSNTTFYGNTGSDSRNLRNLLAHEIGHAIGLDHVCPLNQSKLMEPAFTAAFLGPQHDDVLGAQRHYGDRFESNDTPANATSLGTLSAGQTTVLNAGTDSLGDQDWFAFTVNGFYSLSVSVFPDGRTYLEGPMASGTCGTTSSVNSTAVHDLALEVRTAAGAVLNSAYAAPISSGESITSVVLPPNGGTFLVHVSVNPNPSNLTSGVQLYSLDLNLIPSGSAPPWIVDSSAPLGGVGSTASPFKYIQHAVDAASSGDTILALPGFHTQESWFYVPTVVIVGKSLVLRSIGGPTLTSIHAESEASCIIAQPPPTGSVTIDGFRMEGLGNGEPLVWCQQGNSIISRCDFINDNGAPSILVQDGNADIVNTIVLSVAWPANPVSINNGPSRTVRIVHSTILNSGNGPSVTCNGGGALEVINSILTIAPGWIGSGNSQGLSTSCGTTTTVSHSMVLATTTWPGAGNINVDPQFGFGFGWQLAATSPARDAGTTSLPLGVMPAVDFFGRTRINGVPDMGASEYFDQCGVPPVIVCNPGGAGNGAFAFQHPGTADGLDLFTQVNGLGEIYDDLKVANPGNVVGVGAYPSSGLLHSGVFLVGLMGYPAAAPPPALFVPAFPAIQVDPASAVVLDLGPLPPGGLMLHFPYPGGLAGGVARVQGLVVSTFAANGIFAASPAMEIALQ